MKHYHEFLGPVQDEDDMNVALTCAGHTHLDELLDIKLQLLKLHALLHAGHLEKTDEHEKCIQRIEEVTGYLDRGFQAVYN